MESRRDFNLRVFRLLIARAELEMRIRRLARFGVRQPAIDAQLRGLSKEIRAALFPSPSAPPPSPD